MAAEIGQSSEENTPGLKEDGTEERPLRDTTGQRRGGRACPGQNRINTVAEELKLFGSLKTKSAIFPENVADSRLSDADEFVPNFQNKSVRVLVRCCCCCLDSLPSSVLHTGANPRRATSFVLSAPRVLLC